MDLSILPYVAAAIAMFALIEGGYLFISDFSARSDKRVNRRLQLLEENRKRGVSADSLRRRSMSEGASPWVAKLVSTSPVRRLDALIVGGGVKLSTDQVMFYMAVGTALIIMTFDLALRLGLLISLGVGIALGVLIPLWLLSRVRRRRLARITIQLPDALDILVRSLRVGHPVATGIGLAAKEMPDPIGREFGSVFDEMSYGLDLREALEKMGQRLRLPSISYMVVAMRVQHGTGGNLADVLAALADVMRERQKLHDKVRALSAEARLSGRILAVVPFLVVIGLVLINPHYYDGVANNPGLMAILAGAGVLVLTGVLLLRHLVNSIH